MPEDRTLQGAEIIVISGSEQCKREVGPELD
jgi:16S rRNA U1498 N3-methylase RsmE